MGGKATNTNTVKKLGPYFYQVRPVVSHIEIHLRGNLLTHDSIGEDLKSTQRKFRKEDLFILYDKKMF